MSCKKPPPSPISILRGHKGAVSALHFTNEVDDVITDKPSLISGSESGEIFIWSMKTERTCHRFEGHNGKMILYLCYYKSSLISQGRDGYIHEWKYTENKWNIIRSFSCSSLGFCGSLLFPTEDQVYLITQTGEKMSMTIYDYETSHVLKTLEQKKSPPQNNAEMCMCMKVFTKGSKMYLLIGHDNGFLSLWDYDSGEEISRLKCHHEIVFCLDYDSKYRNCGISGSADDYLQVWKVDDKDQLIEKCSIKITNPCINSVKIRGDGKIVVTAGQDKAIRIFSWKSLKPLAVLSGTMWNNASVSTLAFSDEPIGKYSSVFASGSKDKTICLFSIY